MPQDVALQTDFISASPYRYHWWVSSADVVSRASSHLEIGVFIHIGVQISVTVWPGMPRVPGRVAVWVSIPGRLRWPSPTGG